MALNSLTLATSGRLQAGAQLVTVEAILIELEASPDVEVDDPVEISIEAAEIDVSVETDIEVEVSS
jgi:hypothetical protein